MLGLITYAILDISYNTIIWSSIKTIRCGELLYYYLYDNYSNYKDKSALEYKEVESENEKEDYNLSSITNQTNQTNIIDNLDEIENTNHSPPSYKNTIETISMLENAIWVNLGE